jgi:predicted Zn-dependent protease
MRFTQYPQQKIALLRWALVAEVLVCGASSGLAQSNTASSAAPSYQSEAAVVEQLETVYRYNADGTGERNFHFRVKIQNDAGVRQLSVLSFPYASGNESAQIQSLIVHHADGTTVETPTSDAMDMPAPVTQQAPLYSDLKIIQIPVRGLRAGDTLEYRVHSQRKNAESPSQFWGSFSFSKNLVVLAESLTLDVPTGKFEQVWSPKFKPTETEAAGRHVYVWTSSQLKPTSADKKNDDAPQPKADNKPDVAWSTFRSWQEVGEWYRALSTSSAVPTDALRAQADELTREAKSPEEQIQALYSFVSTHIRYVGIDFGVGRYHPHAAAEVLANQYGDCKDKDTLLEALLHAKGFTSAPALIGASLDMVAELPSPAFFNHVITTVTLPSGKLWLDSTPGVAPFQFLLQPLRDKEVLVILANGASDLERTPALPPFPFADRFEATATLKEDGELTGQVNINYRSDNEILVRAIAQNLAPAQWDQGTQYLAASLGFSGKTSNSTFGRADDTSLPMHVSYDYSRKPFGDWDNHRIVPLFPVNSLPAAPDKKPSDDIDLGALRTESVISRIKIPDGFSAELPDAVHAQTPYATFEKTYKFENGELTAERKMVVLQSKVPAPLWEQYKKFSKDISLGEENWIQLTDNSTAGKAALSPSAVDNDPAAAKLISEAAIYEKSRDWDGALKKLDQAKAIQPKQPFLWGSYGYIAMLQNRPGDAKEAYRRELSLYPSEAYIVELFGGYLHRLGEDQDAVKVLSAYLNAGNIDARVSTQLAEIQSRLNVTDAIATLRRASDADPTNHELQSSLGECLLRNHQNAEVAALSKKILADDAEDARGLNGASYLLAEADGDLTIAEQASRKSIQMEEGQTATAGVSEANAQSFQRTASLVAYWDTLGYILMKEKRLDESRDYLEAAWRNRPDSAVGAHYGQLLEALGDSKEALRVYELSRPNPLRAATGFPELQPIGDSIARLEKAGVASTVKSGAERALQDDRTFKIKLKSACALYSSAVYRIQLAAGSTQGVLKVSGKTPSDDFDDSIKKLTLPHLVPAHSSGRILRDAVLSCSTGQTECFFVLMPLGNITAEHPAN